MFAYLRTLATAAAPLALALGATPALAQQTAATHAEPAAKSIVLVHGAFADGSGWADVYKILTRDGYQVTIVQNPLTAFADDVAATRRAIAAANGKVILVGHSYGGAVITEAGNDPKLAGLVYIAAFAPDKDESVATLTANPVPGAPVPPVLPPQDGFLTLDPAKFAAAFAADVRPDVADVMAHGQAPWSLAALTGKITNPAWRSKPTWYLVAGADKMIPPVAQHQMAARAGATVEEAAGSHAIYVSQPARVARIIEESANGVH